jgi:hypothetical protein
MPKLTIQQINALYLKWSLLPVKIRVPFNDFKETAYPMIGGDGAVVVHWAGSPRSAFKPTGILVLLT